MTILSPSVQALHDLIDQLGRDGTSDAHVHPGKQVRVERSKKLALLDIVFTADDIQEWMAHCTQNRPTPLKAKGHHSGSLDTGTYRARATFRRSINGVTASFRVIGSIPDPATLGIPEQILDLARRDSGLIIIYGPTGSGKTTMNATMLNVVNHEFDKHIYMVEEPIEFVFEESGNTSIVQREVGVHTLDYPSAIQDALRSKPHVILVGEILDPSTAKSALHAATTGHLVFTTAHAGSVTEGIQSFIGQFTADEQPLVRTRLSTSLLAVVVQRLLPTIDGGVVAAREVMVNNVNLADLIRTDMAHMIHAQISSAPGSQTMESDLAKHVVAGVITRDVALSASKNERVLDEEIAMRNRK